MRRRRFSDPAVAEKFKRYAPDQRDQLLQLREIIFDAARDTPGVGKLTEALRWDQPSYLTAETGSGSTIRIDAVKDAPDKIAMYFHCQSGLVEHFRELYGDRLTLAGKRAIVFDKHSKLPEKMIAHCAALALTHHLRKKKKHDGGASHHHRHGPRPG
jgi:Domain of unknown function (DU1801)